MSNVTSWSSKSLSYTPGQKLTTPKDIAAGSSNMSAHIYQTIQYHIPEDKNVKGYKIPY